MNEVDVNAVHKDVDEIDPWCKIVWPYHFPIMTFKCYLTLPQQIGSTVSLIRNE